MSGSGLGGVGASLLPHAIHISAARSLKPGAGVGFVRFEVTSINRQRDRVTLCYGRQPL